MCSKDNSVRDIAIRIANKQLAKDGKPLIPVPGQPQPTSPSVPAPSPGGGPASNGFLAGHWLTKTIRGRSLLGN